MLHRVNIPVSGAGAEDRNLHDRVCHIRLRLNLFRCRAVRECHDSKAIGLNGDERFFYPQQIYFSSHVCFI